MDDKVATIPQEHIRAAVAAILTFCTARTVRLHRLYGVATLPVAFPDDRPPREMQAVGGLCLPFDAGIVAVSESVAQALLRLRPRITA